MSMFINRNWVALWKWAVTCQAIFSLYTHMHVCVCVCVCSEKARYQCHKSFYFSLHYISSICEKEGRKSATGGETQRVEDAFFFLYFGTFMLSFDLFKYVIHKAIFSSWNRAAKSMMKSFTEKRRILHFPFHFFYVLAEMCHVFSYQCVILIQDIRKKNYYISYTYACTYVKTLSKYTLPKMLAFIHIK